MDYLDAIGRQNIFEHDQSLALHAVARLSEIPNLRLFGPRQARGGVVSFVLPEVHAHDVVTLADHHGIALRGGHHCNQPLMRKLGVPSTARASFYFYNTVEEIEALVTTLKEIQKFFSRGL
jgi:cysteine desulfurase/selenocysteine lyase